MDAVISLEDMEWFLDKNSGVLSRKKARTIARAFTRIELNEKLTLRVLLPS
jgi:hypothetical protein